MNPPALLYDGHCKFCRRQAARLSNLSGHRIQLESFHDAGVLERYPAVRREDCEKALQLVMGDGRVYSGAAAVAEAIRLRPVFKWLGSLFYLPGMKQSAERIYAWVAHNRFRHQA